MLYPLQRALTQVHLICWTQWPHETRSIITPMLRLTNAWFRWDMLQDNPSKGWQSQVWFCFQIARSLYYASTWQCSSAPSLTDSTSKHTSVLWAGLHSTSMATPGSQLLAHSSPVSLTATILPSRLNANVTINLIQPAESEDLLEKSSGSSSTTFCSQKNRPRGGMALPATELLADHDGIAVRLW